MHPCMSVGGMLRGVSLISPPGVRWLLLRHGVDSADECCDYKVRGRGQLGPGPRTKLGG